jgi:transcriptional regulator with XRE-family HTH domain
MGGNHHNWHHLAVTLRARLDDIGSGGWHALYDAGVRGTYLTFLLTGRARLKLEFVKPVAQALNLDENRLFCTALEGMHQTQDLPYLNEFLWRMIESFEEVRPQEEHKKKKKKKHKKRKQRKKKTD